MLEPARLTYERSRRLLDRLLALLQQHLGDELVSVALFGSVARGEGGPTSDLDLLIVHRGRQEEIRDRFVEVVLELRQTREYRELRGAGYVPDPYPVFFTTDQLARRPWLLLDVLDHGIVLYDPAAALRQELERLRDRVETLGARKVVRADGTWYWDLKPDWKPGEVIQL